MKILIKARYWLLVIWLSTKWMFRINLGDKVWWSGWKLMRFTVLNGVRPGSWRLAELMDDNDGWVSRNECRKSWTLPNMLRSFRSGYRFYMINWYDIWVNEGITAWMRRCRIW